jgi:hypothetical protein
LCKAPARAHAWHSGRRPLRNAQGIQSIHLPPRPVCATNAITPLHIPRQQDCLAQQTLLGLRPADELAPPLGAHLERGEVLLRRLSTRKGGCL